MDGKATTAGGFMISKKGGAFHVVVVYLVVEIKPQRACCYD
jgi:hypothetical protein